MVYSDEELKKLHKVLIEILEVVVSVCETHNITYFLAEGTLLGAVRHHGIIPWDDDIDIAVPRKDYERLMKLLPEALPQGYYLQYTGNDRRYWLPFAKVRKMGTAFYETTWQGLSDKTKQQIYIDIFPLDEVKDQQLAKKQRLLVHRLSHIGYVKCCNDKENILRYYAFKLLPMCFVQWLQKKVSRIQKNGHCYICFGSAYGAEKHFIDKEKYLPPKQQIFEGREYSVPADSEFVLRSIYGADYMQLPPEEKRKNHKPLYMSFDEQE